jgi:hypothetical protein
MITVAGGIESVVFMGGLSSLFPKLLLMLLIEPQNGP